MLTILRVRGASCRDIDDQSEARRYFTHCVCPCPWLTSIARKETTSVVMILEVTTRCSPVSALFVSACRYCFPCLCRTQHVGNVHHQRLFIMLTEDPRYGGTSRWSTSVPTGVPSTR